MNTLLHICCAPCANQCIDVLRADGFGVTGFWYNPNIHPFTEYRSRRNCLRDYAQSIGLPLLEKNDYGLRPCGPPPSSEGVVGAAQNRRSHSTQKGE